MSTGITVPPPEEPGSRPTEDKLPPSPSASPPADTGAGVRITLVANAGILVEYAGRQLLIDALHEGHRLYPATPPAALQALLAGRPPFAAIEALIITHNHLDHFTPRLVLPVLERHRGARFIADEASVQALLQAGRDCAEPVDAGRVQIMPWRLPDIAEAEKGGCGRLLPAPLSAGPFQIQPIPFQHEGQRYADIANVGLLIRVAGVTILYPGDARMAPANFALLSRCLPPPDIAVVMFPYIATGRGQNLLREVIRPKNLVVVHWPDPARDLDRLTENARRYYERTRGSLPPAWLLEHSFDTILF